MANEDKQFVLKEAAATGTLLESPSPPGPVRKQRDSQGCSGGRIDRPRVSAGIVRRYIRKRVVAKFASANDVSLGCSVWFV